MRCQYCNAVLHQHQYKVDSTGVHETGGHANGLCVGGVVNDDTFPIPYDDRDTFDVDPDLLTAEDVLFTEGE